MVDAVVRDIVFIEYHCFHLEFHLNIEIQLFSAERMSFINVYCSHKEIFFKLLRQFNWIFSQNVCVCVHSSVFLKEHANSSTSSSIYISVN